jgi:hypothetical protein
MPAGPQALIEHGWKLGAGRFGAEGQTAEGQVQKVNCLDTDDAETAGFSLILPSHEPPSPTSSNETANGVFDVSAVVIARPR